MAFTVSVRTRRTLLVVFLALILSPVWGVEALYRFGLRYAGELPQPPGPQQVTALHRALWAEMEDSAELRLEPLWPWTLLWNFGKEMVRVKRGIRGPIRFAAGSSAASAAARQVVHSNKRYRGNGEWHLGTFAAMVWFSRHFDAEGVTTWLADRMYFGRNAHGIDAASRAYFGVSSDSLTWSQKALLIGLLQRPGDFDPHCKPESANRRRAYILQKFSGLGLITREEADTASAMPIEALPIECASGARR